MFVGAIESGGTKFVCAVGDDAGHVLDEARFPTRDPESTLREAVEFLTQQGRPLDAIGISSFGPIDLNRASPQYGYITQTPKAGWAFTDVVGAVRVAFPDIPIGFDTDVNGAALGEHRWGAAQDWDTFVYLTVGTGIGGGGMLDGRLLHGLIHPEMGHVVLPRRADDPLARGVCPFHETCLEGLASGPSIQARWGAPGETLPPDHAAWEMEATYLAAALADIIAILSPEGIILGGSVMHQRHLFPLIREQVCALTGGYYTHPAFENLDAYIVPPGLGDRAGVVGAIALGLAAREHSI